MPLGYHDLERVCRAEQDVAKVPKLSRNYFHSMTPQSNWKVSGMPRWVTFAKAEVLKRNGGRESHVGPDTATVLKVRCRW